MDRASDGNLIFKSPIPLLFACSEKICSNNFHFFNIYTPCVLCKLVCVKNRQRDKNNPMVMPRIIKIFALRHASTEPFFVVVYSLLMQIVDMRRQLRGHGPPPTMRHRGLNMTAFERPTLLTHSQHFLATFTHPSFHPRNSFGNATFLYRQKKMFFQISNLSNSNLSSS